MQLRNHRAKTLPVTKPTKKVKVERKVYDVQQTKGQRQLFLLNQVNEKGLIPVLDMLERVKIKSKDIELVVDQDILWLYKKVPVQDIAPKQPETLQELIGDCPPGKIRNILHPQERCVQEKGRLGKKVYKQIDVGQFRDFETPPEIPPNLQDFQEKVVNQIVDMLQSAAKVEEEEDVPQLSSKTQRELNDINEAIDAEIENLKPGSALYQSLNSMVWELMRYTATVVITDMMQHHFYRGVWANVSAEGLEYVLPPVIGVVAVPFKIRQWLYNEAAKKAFQLLKQAVGLNGPLRLPDFVTKLQLHLSDYMSKLVRSRYRHIMRTIFVIFIVMTSLGILASPRPYEVTLEATRHGLDVIPRLVSIMKRDTSNLVEIFRQLMITSSLEGSGVWLKWWQGTLLLMRNSASLLRRNTLLPIGPFLKFASIVFTADNLSIWNLFGVQRSLLLGVNLIGNQFQNPNPNPEVKKEQKEDDIINPKP